MTPELSPLTVTALSIWDQIEAELRVLPKRPDQLLEPAALAALLSISPRTLEGWRRERRGPAVTRVEGAVRYRYGDILNWITAQNPQPEMETAQGQSSPRA